MSDKEIEFKNRLRALCYEFGAYFYLDFGSCWYPDDHPTPRIALEGERGFFTPSDFMDEEFERRAKKVKT